MTLEEAKKEIEGRIDLWRKGLLYVPDGLSLALAILNEVDTEPVANPDKLTLRELAIELKKIFRFKYLTCEIYGGCRFYAISLWDGKPEWKGCSWWCDDCDLLADIKLYMKFADLDLFEYREADGIIDCSKCIVEAE